MLCRLLCVVQLLDPGGRRSSPQFNLFRELVIRAYLAVRHHTCNFQFHSNAGTLEQVLVIPVAKTSTGTSVTNQAPGRVPQMLVVLPAPTAA